MDRFNIKSKANEIRIEISKNIKQCASLKKFCDYLEQNAVAVITDDKSDFRISFSLKKDAIVRWL